MTSAVHAGARIPHVQQDPDILLDVLFKNGTPDDTSPYRIVPTLFGDANLSFVDGTFSPSNVNTREAYLLYANPEYLREGPDAWTVEFYTQFVSSPNVTISGIYTARHNPPLINSDILAYYAEAGQLGAFFAGSFASFPVTNTAAFNTRGHFAAVFDNVLNRQYFFVNGVYQAASSLDPNSNTASFTPFNPAFVSLGPEGFQGARNYNFDSFRITKRAKYPPGVNFTPPPRYFGR